jgi:hypothetical protein
MTVKDIQATDRLISSNRQFAGGLSIGPASTNAVDAPPNFLAGIEVVFLDATVALTAAQNAGLEQSAKVLASSPALTLGAEPRIKGLGQHFSGQAMWDYMDAMHASSLLLFRAFMDDPRLAPYAAAVARRNLYFGSHYLAKSALLRETDFQEPRAIVLVRTGDEYLDTLINPPWAELLADNEQLKVMHVEHPAKHEVDQHPGLLERLRIAPLARAYRVARILSDRLPFLFPRGDAFVMTENELLRETAVKLALCGFRIRQLRAPNLDIKPLADKVEQAVEDVASPLINAAFAAWAPPSAIPRLNGLFIGQLKDDVAAQDAAEAGWGVKLDEFIDHRPAVILTNYPKAVYGPGLARAARRFGIPYVAFQHGLGREFGATHFVGQPGYENVVADHVMVYNDQSVAATNAIPFGVGKAFAAGLPNEYQRAGRHRRPRKNAPPLIYVSTNVYTGNRETPTGVLTDTQRALQELELVEEVLQVLPHRVTFKTYPDRRYWDDAPVVEKARQLSNIEVFERRQNLRYLLPDARVILTSRATSTIGHCVMSGKPVVFINYPDQQPLKPEALGAFEAGLFLFDGGADDFTQRLREFLSQSLQEIERQWREKSPERQLLIRRYFTKSDRRAGAVAARRIIEIAQNAVVVPSSVPSLDLQGGTK